MTSTTHTHNGDHYSDAECPCGSVAGKPVAEVYDATVAEIRARYRTAADSAHAAWHRGEITWQVRDARREAAGEVQAAALERARQVLRDAGLLPAYGWCGYCHGFSYSDLRHGACGDCREVWARFPAAMPVSLLSV